MKEDELSIKVLDDGRMSMADTALYLGIHPVTLRINYKRPDWPPYVNLGRRVFFFKDDIDKWFKEHYSKTWNERPYPSKRQTTK